MLDKAGLHIAAKRVDVGQVEKGLLLHPSVLVDDLYTAHALDDKDPARAVVRVGDVRGVVEPFGNLDQSDFHVAGQLAARTRDLVRGPRDARLLGLRCRKHRHQESHA